MGVENWTWTLRLTILRHRRSLRGAVLVVMTCALIAFVAPLLYGLILRHNDRTVRSVFGTESIAAHVDPCSIDAGSAGAPPHYQAIMSLSDLKLNLDAPSVSGELAYTVCATTLGPDIDRVDLGLQNDVNGDTKVVGFTSPDLKLESYGSLEWLKNPDGKPKGQVAMHPKLVAREISPSVYYPFDSYAFDLAILACANCSDVKAWIPNRIATKELEVSISDQYFAIFRAGGDSAISSDAGTRYVLRRPFFVRWVSVWVGVFLLFFLIYLLQLSDSKDLLVKSLGYFGTMWAFRQLIVPTAIAIFPTAIDYWILLLFSILFIVVTCRVALGQLGATE